MKETLKKYGIYTILLVISLGLTFSCNVLGDDDDNNDDEYLAVAYIANSLLSGACMQVVKTFGAETYTATPRGVPKGGCNIDTLQGRTRQDAVRIAVGSFDRQLKIANFDKCSATATYMTSTACGVLGATSCRNGAADVNAWGATEEIYADTYANTDWFPVADAAVETRAGFKAATGTGVHGLTDTQSDAITIAITPYDTDPITVLFYNSVPAGGGGPAGDVTCITHVLQHTSRLLNLSPQASYGALGIANMTGVSVSSITNPIIAGGAQFGATCVYGSAQTVTCATLNETWTDGAKLNH